MCIFHRHKPVPTTVEEIADVAKFLGVTLERAKFLLQNTKPKQRLQNLQRFEAFKASAPSEADLDICRAKKAERNRLRNDRPDLMSAEEALERHQKMLSDSVEEKS